MAVNNILENRFLKSVGFSVESVRLDQRAMINLLDSIRHKQKSNYFRKLVEYDASDKDPDEVRDWLYGLPKSSTMVSVIWLSVNIGVRIDYHLFVQHYDDLWYPSSDDIWIVNDNILIELNHEEIFSFYETAGGETHKNKVVNLKTMTDFEQ
jgi:hypothetical protein